MNLIIVRYFRSFAILGILAFAIGNLASAQGDFTSLYFPLIFKITIPYPSTTRVSIAPNGSPWNGAAGVPSISADGRFVAFGWMIDPVEDDFYFENDVYVYDRESGQIVLASVSSDGSVGNSDSWFPSISADGRFVAFSSTASNLVNGDTINGNNIFLHDLHTKLTELISQSFDGSQGIGDSRTPSVSADGRYVAFDSFAENLVPADQNQFPDVFVRDRLLNLTLLISINSNGSQGNNWSVGPSISADGRYVAFTSKATNLVEVDPADECIYGECTNVFIYDRQTGQPELASVGMNGTLGNGDSRMPAISSDGRFVAFVSFATNLVSEDTNAQPDVFVYDRQTSETTRVSVASDGTQANGRSGDDFFGEPSISADGRYVAFASEANNLVAGDTNECKYYYDGTCPDIFVHDIQTGETMRVSVSSDRAQANHWSTDPAISSNGHFVAFASWASNLVRGDYFDFCFYGNCTDIFVNQWLAMGE
jgi:Tol biopolymer transport system component